MNTQPKIARELLQLADQIFERLTLDDLQILDDPESVARESRRTQRTWVLFSLWNLLVDGAIAEFNIHTYSSSPQLPPPVDSWRKTRPEEVLPLSQWRGSALDKAWKGTSLLTADFRQPRPNAIGTLSLLFFLLYLIEGYCQIALAADVVQMRDDPTLANVTNNILAGRFQDRGVESLRYCLRYRDTWHTFGRHRKEYRADHSRMPHLSFGAGDMIPVISEADCITLLQDMLDLLVEIDEHAFR